MSLSSVATHSTGVNWGQALATWVPIVLSLGAVIVAIARWVKKMQEARAKSAEVLMSGLIQAFATTLNVRFSRIDDHLEDQDKRLNRIDRNTGTDSS